jgi:acetylornithine/succinyldiaminopimelate/putrescine aminotransferase
MLVYGKGLGGGFPIGALSTSKEKMKLFKEKPILGHITTFGGHPVISSAALANLKETLGSEIMKKINKKEALIKKLLCHDLILEIRGKGLMLALIMKNKKIAEQLVENCLKKGLILFFLLFENKAVRITPPLTINFKEIKLGCEIITNTLDEFNKTVN